jgi:hypothetical protein
VPKKAIWPPTAEETVDQPFVKIASLEAPPFQPSAEGAD